MEDDKPPEKPSAPPKPEGETDTRYRITATVTVNDERLSLAEFLASLPKPLKVSFQFEEGEPEKPN